jgi:hypothetical protein
MRAAGYRLLGVLTAFAVIGQVMVPCFCSAGVAVASHCESMAMPSATTGDHCGAQAADNKTPSLASPNCCCAKGEKSSAPARVAAVSPEPMVATVSYIDTPGTVVFIPASAPSSGDRRDSLHSPPLVLRV